MQFRLLLLALALTYPVCGHPNAPQEMFHFRVEIFVIRRIFRGPDMPYLASHRPTPPDDLICFSHVFLFFQLLEAGFGILPHARALEGRFFFFLRALFYGFLRFFSRGRCRGFSRGCVADI